MYSDFKKRNGYKVFEFSKQIGKDQYEYTDEFIGEDKFMGVETVKKNGKIIWMMSYYGEVLERLEEDYFNSILRPALCMVGVDEEMIPARGPARLDLNGHLYTFDCHGTIDSFFGEESIYVASTLVYKLHCHGGFIR